MLIHCCLSRTSSGYIPGIFKTFLSANLFRSKTFFRSLIIVSTVAVWAMWIVLNVVLYIYWFIVELGVDVLAYVINICIKILLNILLKLASLSELCVWPVFRIHPFMNYCLMEEIVLLNELSIHDLLYALFRSRGWVWFFFISAL